jgi:CheY-like chemotaxis protein
MPNRILLVEDNENNAEILVRRLSRRGFEVLQARNGLEGIERARRDLPDLILLDMDLPTLDGWQAARQLKSDSATTGIPIIAVTAYAMADDRQRSLEAGCDDFETKPVELTSLLEKMSKLLPRQKPA